MNMVLLTQDGTFIIGQVAWILGIIMDVIFNTLDALGLPNVGLAIILFTIVVNFLMMPLTIRQQKFSKLSAKMNPEIKAIQAKYKGRKDQDSMMAQNQEVQEVYAKYGVSPTGSCVQLLIQMPILFALYRVIQSMPAYVGKIREVFVPLVEKLVSTEGAIDFVQNFSNSNQFKSQFANNLFISGDSAYVQNTLIDCLNRASTGELESIGRQFPQLLSDVDAMMATTNIYNNFFGLNMGNSPSYIITQAMQNGGWLVAIGALSIPVLSAVTQWLNVKLMPQPAVSDDGDNAMASSMKTMNMVMPIMSAVFCFSFPTGLGLYWIAGSVVRSVQQVLINKHIDKMDFDALLEKNADKSAKKIEKIREKQAKLNAYAAMKTKNIQVSGDRQDQDTEAYKDAPAGSLRDRANMVKKYNEKNTKK